MHCADGAAIRASFQRRQGIASQSPTMVVFRTFSAGVAPWGVQAPVLGLYADRASAGGDFCLCLNERGDLFDMTFLTFGRGFLAAAWMLLAASVGAFAAEPTAPPPAQATAPSPVPTAPQIAPH